MDFPVRSFPILIPVSCLPSGNNCAPYAEHSHQAFQRISPTAERPDGTDGEDYQADSQNCSARGTHLVGRAGRGVDDHQQRVFGRERLFSVLPDLWFPSNVLCTMTFLRTVEQSGSSKNTLRSFWTVCWLISSTFSISSSTIMNATWNGFGQCALPSAIAAATAVTIGPQGHGTVRQYRCDWATYVQA